MQLYIISACKEFTSLPIINYKSKSLVINKAALLYIDIVIINKHFEISIWSSQYHI